MKRSVLALILALFGHITFAQVNVDSSPMVLGVIHGANLNTTSDQSIPIISAPKYIITQITVTNASGTPTLAVGGFYTAASKGGVNIVAATQIYSSLTSSTKFVNAALLTILTTDVRTESQIFFSLTTAQGSAMTADVYILGTPLP